jgi:VRR-NUC domain
MTFKLSKETLEQITCMNWLKLQYPAVWECTFHIANERKCSAGYGKVLKKMGVKKGISDIFIAYPSKNFHGCFIEMKSLDGVKSPEQVAWINLMQKNDYFADFCFGSEDFIRTIHKYLK